jgi:hypothetical protein
MARPFAAFAATAALLAALALGHPALAPEASAQIAGARPATPQDAWNPKPAEGDFTVPLPCELSMAFRPVFIPEKGYLGELEGYFGSELQSANDETQSFSRRHKVYVGSPLSVDNLPEAYRATASAMKAKLSSDSDSRQLYLVGKYEVTVAQYDAIMKEGCPFDGKTAALPVTGVTWYDAQLFSERLMSWILQYYPDALPAMTDDARIVGIIRLPTEDEWEYAARGGHMVNRDTMNSMDFFPMELGEEASDYGLYYDEGAPPPTAPGRAGRRKPNPAGLYDTVGNASEMTMDAYKITVGSRLHGSAGGFVQKGGSFRTAYFKAVPGAREELPFFYRSGPVKSDDMGFRLVISSVNGGSIRRINELSEELSRASATDTTLIAADPLKTVDSLIQSAESEPEKQALQALRQNLESYNTTVNAGRKVAVRAHVWGLLYTMLGMRMNNAQMLNASAQRQIEINFIKRINDMIKEKNGTPEELRKLPEALAAREKNLARFQTFIEDAEDSFTVMRAHYETLLLEAKSFPQDLVLEQLDYVKQDIRGDDYFNRELRECDTRVDMHVRDVLQGKSPSKIPRTEMEVQAVSVKPPPPERR